MRDSDAIDRVRLSIIADAFGAGLPGLPLPRSGGGPVGPLFVARKVRAVRILNRIGSVCPIVRLCRAREIALQGVRVACLPGGVMRAMAKLVDVI